MVKSSSNIDPCSCATQIIEALLASQCITVADVFVLMCLRLMGVFAHSLMAIGKGLDDDILNGICKFLACTSSKWVINYYLSIARCLVNGTPVDLSSFLLGELYRSLFLLSTEPKQSHGGPVWLIQMWAYSYFPSIAPELHPTIESWSYGEVWMHARYPKEVPFYPTCFKLFSDSSKRRSPEDFMPFEAKRYGSKDFQQFSSQGFFKGDVAWGACFQSRNLVVIRSTNAGVEAYCPSLVVRQFGLVQLLRVSPIWTKNTDWTSWVSISKDEAKQTYMTHFNNEDDLIEVIQGCCPTFLLYQLADADFDHMASYVTPQPLQQISHYGKKIGGDPSSQKFSTTEVSFDPLISLVDIVTNKVPTYNAELAEVAFDLRNQLMKSCQANSLQNATFKKAKENLKLQAPILRLPASSEQGTCTLTKHKIPEVEEVNPTVSTKEPLDEELDDATTLSNLIRSIDEHKQVLGGVIEAHEVLEVEDRRMAQELKEAKQLAAALKAKTKTEDTERKRLEAEVEKRRQAEKAEEERVVEIEKRLEIKKKEKVETEREQQELEKKKEKEEKKKKEEREKEKKEEVEAARRKAEQVVPREAKLIKQAVGAAVMSVQKVAQPTIEVRTSIETATPLDLGDIDKLLEDVSLTLQQCQTPTKTSSTLTPLEPTKDQLQAVVDQLKELLQKPVGTILLDVSLVD
uniref:Aminotransferase-like plant mobile domain-containing protein n=1 Tax=Fagus sylvatica TaxID=28930 RepID=A0A2N9EPX4_FAGSY